MRPSEALAGKRLAVLAAATRHRLMNPRIFGSVLAGVDREGSDIDLLVDALPGVTLFDLGKFQEDLEALLGVRVDVRTPGDLPAGFRDKILLEARLADYLGHMRKAAEDACEFTEGMTEQAFLVDHRTQQAVVMSLVIIGEAATKIMERHEGFAEEHPEFEWRAMRGMRNRIAHGYFEVDHEIV